MAVDLTNKRRDIVSRYVQVATQIDTLMDQFVTLNDERNQCGTFDEAAFAGNEHIDATDLTTLASRFAQFRAVVDVEFARDILRKARR